MKALFVSHSAAPSGAEILLLRLAKALKRVQPTFLFAQPGPMVERFREHGFPVHVGMDIDVAISREETSAGAFAVSAFRLARGGWRLAGDSAMKDIDVIVAQSIKALVIAWPLATRLRKPLVWSVHDRIAADYMGSVKAALVRALGQVGADAYIVNSRATLATIAVGRKPCIIVYPGLDLAEFAAGDASHVTAPKHPLRVVNIGRLSEWKGQHVFLDAFNRAFGDTDATAIVVGGALFGEQAYEERLKAQAMALESAPRITFTGHVDDVRPCLARSDILVHSSIVPEPFGSVIIEGMAMGKPVIATRPGGPAEIITDGEDGLLVPCNDVKAMAAAMSRLADDPGLRERLGRNATRRAEFFSIERQAEALEDWLASWAGLARGKARG